MLEKIIKSFDKYNKEARVYPAILSLLPAIIFIFSFTNKLLNTYYGLFSSSFLIFLIIYYATDIIRNVGKYWEGKIFNNELSFPTTEVLLHKNGVFSKQKKGEIYEKIKKDFDYALCTVQEELADENEARKRINEAVGRIRQGLKNNPILLQKNIRYGFWRNLISVSSFSFLLSYVSLLAAIFVFDDYITTSIEYFFVVFFIFIFIYRKRIVNFLGFQYADQLFLEYLSKK